MRNLSSGKIPHTHEGLDVVGAACLEFLELEVDQHGDDIVDRPSRSFVCLFLQAGCCDSQGVVLCDAAAVDCVTVLQEPRTLSCDFAGGTACAQSYQRFPEGNVVEVCIPLVPVLLANALQLTEFEMQSLRRFCV